MNPQFETTELRVNSIYSFAGISWCGVIPIPVVEAVDQLPLSVAPEETEIVVGETKVSIFVFADNPMSNADLNKPIHPILIVALPVFTMRNFLIDGPVYGIHHLFAMSAPRLNNSSAVIELGTTENSPNFAPPHLFVAVVQKYGVVLPLPSPIVVFVLFSIL
jgi:hypothetical protein